MSSRRTLIVLAAVVIGALAAFVLFSYVNGVEDRAYDSARRVEVFVVRQDVPRGLPGEQALAEDYIAKDEIPQEFRPSTAFTSANVDGINGLVASTDLSAGSVVVEGNFVPAEEAFVSSSQQIEEGRVAITISVDEVRGVAGLVVPGDRVNMIVNDPAIATNLDDPNAATTAGKIVLYQNVEVLAVGSSLRPDLGQAPPEGEEAVTEPVNSNLMTLSVPPLAASRIAYFGSEGVWLTLVPPENSPLEVPPIDASSAIPSELTPYPDEDL